MMADAGGQGMVQGGMQGGMLAGVGSGMGGGGVQGGMQSGMEMMWVGNGVPVDAFFGPPARTHALIITTYAHAHSHTKAHVSPKTHR